MIPVSIMYTSTVVVPCQAIIKKNGGCPTCPAASSDLFVTRHLQGGGNKFDDLAGEYQDMKSLQDNGSGDVVAAARRANHGEFCLCGYEDIFFVIMSRFLATRLVYLL